MHIICPLLPTFFCYALSQVLADSYFLVKSMFPPVSDILIGLGSWHLARCTGIDLLSNLMVKLLLYCCITRDCKQVK